MVDSGFTLVLETGKDFSSVFSKLSESDGGRDSGRRKLLSASTLPRFPSERCGANEEKIGRFQKNELRFLP